MKSTLLGKLSRVLDVAVFVFTTMAIAGIFYEGMTLKWYDIVGVLVFPENPGRQRWQERFMSFLGARMTFV